MRKTLFSLGLACLVLSCAAETGSLKLRSYTHGMTKAGVISSLNSNYSKLDSTSDPEIVKVEHVKIAGMSGVAEFFIKPDGLTLVSWSRLGSSNQDFSQLVNNLEKQLGDATLKTSLNANWLNSDGYLSSILYGDRLEVVWNPKDPRQVRDSSIIHLRDSVMKLIEE